MNFDNEKPIYKQLLEQIQIQIIQNNYPAGSKLPSVRDLAKVYRVNPNTVQRSLQMLEEMQLIVTDRTNGKFVTTDIKQIEKMQAQLAKDTVCWYLEHMKALSFSQKEAIQYIEKYGKECESHVSGV